MEQEAGNAETSFFKVLRVSDCQCWAVNGTLLSTPPQPQDVGSAAEEKSGRRAEPEDAGCAETGWPLNVPNRVRAHFASC